MIKDMRMTLEEQEQTQVEQDQVLEAKLEEAEWLATGKMRLFIYLT
jgi:kinesin family protein 20